MRLEVVQGQEIVENDPARVRFFVRCQLILDITERGQRAKFGVAPFIEPFNNQLSLLTATDLKELTSFGLRRTSLDIRELIVFVTALRVACENLLNYWHLSETTNLTGIYSIVSSAQDEVPPLEGFDTF
jgi:hypothetical protein